LLNALRVESFFTLPAPKSTGRDLFHLAWLNSKLGAFSTIAAADVQATLAAFTATTLADAIAGHAPTAKAVYVCGGGAYNTHLMQQLQQALNVRNHPAMVQTTEVLGISPNHVEAFAFAWLAQRHVERRAGNLPAVTGATGPRILGALYPA
jgi:anhydro-N-acetylmuramic acid kinase